MKMESKTCMNEQCGVSSSSDWRKGWTDRSGEFVSLCDKCGYVYDQSIFCEVFHSKESGWRECTSCGKRLHCGCIASRSLIELLDSRGVNCISCAQKAGISPMASDDKHNGYVLKVDSASALQSSAAESQLECGTAGNSSLIQLSNSTAGCLGLKQFLQFQNNDLIQSFPPMKEEFLPPPGANGNVYSSNHTSYGPFQSAKFEANLGEKNISESVAHANLTMSLGSPGSQSPFHNAVVDERGKTSATYQQASRSRYLLPKPPRSILASSSEADAPQIRVARPPADGRGKNQMLARYWPKITDQELQQISGDSNSTIVPLFEKVLSASDAGRIGRLVLPKACAEAYFPPISQPEGLPLRIQDIKGKEWVFQFRFWPNNNSRMYVLEGVTPCIQSMQLQAGDTVTFSRMDPEGKLVMGFRKATISSTVQEVQLPAVPPGMTHSNESYFSGVFENLPIMSGHPGFLASLKGSSDPHFNALSKHLISAAGDINWYKDKHEDIVKDNLLLTSMLVPERKRTRNIGSKNKRLIMDNVEALELKLTWEEAQDLLRPPPSTKPSVIKIDDHDFEEYEEPPVFGKRSIFIARSTGEQEQWVQCDSCCKWRKLPMDILLPSKWTCAENSWDQYRSSCCSPDELTSSEQETLLRLSKDFKRKRIAISQTDASTVGENSGDPTPVVATTTKHPRHRPGCSCIVCIQPPSGKGKHPPSCTCNVCMTVRRRFKTLTMRKQKRQSEREAEIAQRNQQQQNARGSKEESEMEAVSGHNTSANEPDSIKLTEIGRDNIDLNSHPPENSRIGLPMLTLLQVATLPLQTYLKQNGLASLTSDQQQQQLTSTSQVPSQAPGSEEQVHEDRNSPSAAAAAASQEQDNPNEGTPGPEALSNSK